MIQFRLFFENVLTPGLTAAVMLIGIISVRAQDQRSDKSEAAFQVGVYDLEEAFQAHPAQAELTKALGMTQTRMQAAEQAGDQQKVQQIQQQYEQTRGQIIGKFEEDVADAMPAAAEAAGVKVAVSQVTYTAAGVETRDITSQLIKSFNKELNDVPVEVDEGKTASLEIGTYDVEEAFQAHPAQEELSQALGMAQARMQQAQQEGDQQKMQQVQQQYEETHGQVIGKFEEDVADAMPVAAEAAGVKVAAQKVVYAASEVQSKDITPQLIKALNGN